MSQDDPLFPSEGLSAATICGLRLKNPTTRIVNLEDWGNYIEERMREFKEPSVREGDIRMGAMKQRTSLARVHGVLTLGLRKY